MSHFWPSVRLVPLYETQGRNPVWRDHKPGAGSNIGVAELARSAPDGYTLGWITVASKAIFSTPRELAAFIREDTERWAPVIRASGARVE